MESFKIKHFKRNNTNEEFPWFHSLTPYEAQLLYARLLKQMDLDNTKPQDLVRRVNKIGERISEENAANEKFELLKVCNFLNLKPQEKIFINWYHYDDIDEFFFAELNKYFDDIWYPGSDDIDIFDDTLSWILSVSHNGEIHIVYLKDRVG